MATVYRGHREFYEEDGRIYGDSSKRIEYDPETYENITNKVRVEVVEPVVAVSAEPSETVSEVVATVVESPVVETVSANDLKCSVCGFEAKSNAGLAVHRMKHRIGA